MEIIRALLRPFVSANLKDISKEIVLVTKLSYTRYINISEIIHDQITGTGHGIGKELALLYAGYGSTVVCVDINEKNNAKTVRDVKRLNRGTVYCYGWLQKRTLSLG